MPVKFFVTCFCVSLFFSSSVLSAESVVAPSAAAIASSHPLATSAGMDILAKGGNAFDAAVTMSAVLSVVQPYSAGLGGGGFWLLHRASDGFDVMLDGRERAPLKAHRDLYLDEKGEIIKGLSVDGVLSAAIPGVPAAIVHLAEKYGRLPLTQTLAPAIYYAHNGFLVDASYLGMAEFRLPALRLSLISNPFLIKGELPKLGDRLVQKELARTLELLAQQGHKGFYSGEVAEKLVAGVQAAGGIWTKEDLDTYQVIEREPLYGQYKGLRITSVPPPSSGGVALITMLNMLASYDLKAMTKIERSHVLIEVMRRAYRDRAQYLGDSDHVSIPLQRLLSMDHAQKLRASIRLDEASLNVPLGKPVIEGMDTTHFSVIDKAGNRVAATMSINYPFGSAFTVPGTGVLLNDEMDDFSAKVGAANVYGLVGTEANAIAPGKRPLSSMTPSFAEDDNRLLVVGTPGGSRIISMVLLAILDFYAGNDVESLVGLPRFHHQYLPNVVHYEKDTFTDDELSELDFLGHQLRLVGEHYGDMQAVLWDKKNNRVTAASDSRGGGLSLVE